MMISKSLEQTKQGLRVKSTKSEEPCEIGLLDHALDVLRDHRVEQDRDRELYGPDYQDHNLVFCQPNGAYYSPDRMGARVSELMRKAGLHGVSLHSLRHSHASVLLSQGCRRRWFPSASATRTRTSRWRFTATPCRRTNAPPRTCGAMRWRTSSRKSASVAGPGC
jgi:hypothetical protein